MTDRLKNEYLCLWRKDSEVIRPQSSSGCRHLLYKSFDRPQLESSNVARWARCTCWEDFSALWWGFGVHVLVTELLARLHDGGLSISRLLQSTLTRLIPALTEAVYCDHVVLVVLFIWAIFAPVQKKKKKKKKSYRSVRNWPHARASSASSCSSYCTVTNILGRAEVHRAGKHLAIIEPCGRPVNLLSALSWECVETYELLHNYM